MLVRSALVVWNGLVVLPLSFLDDSDPFGEATEGVMGLYGSIKTLLEVVLILAAMLILARIVLKLMGGDKDSARTLLYWLIGLALGFALLETLSVVLRNIG